MKPTDLMIGDWVIIKDYPMKAMPKQMSPEYYTRSLVEIEPIPLTSEILEKNGYRNSVLVDDYYIAHGIHYNVNSKYIMFGYEYGSVLEVKCEYVHELQHILKMCGIEKDIIL